MNAGARSGPQSLLGSKHAFSRNRVGLSTRRLSVGSIIFREAEEALSPIAEGAAPCDHCGMDHRPWPWVGLLAFLVGAITAAALVLPSKRVILPRRSR